MSAYFSISKVLCGVLGNVQVLNTRSRSRRFGDERVGTASSAKTSRQSFSRKFVCL